VGKGEDAATHLFAEANEFLGPGIDLRGRLAAGAAIPEQLPAGIPRVNLLAGHPFVLAIVELAEERRLARIGKSSDHRRLDRALERAGENTIEFNPGQARSQGPSFGFAVGGERQVGAAGVAAVERPLGLAVTGEIEVESQAGLPIISGRPERSERLALSMTAPARTRWPGRMHTSPTAA
jgi:hypothetical protein